MNRWCRLTILVPLVLLCPHHTQGADGEATDRKVDAVALAAQEEAVKKLRTMTKKYSGTSQEAVLLARLGDYEQQSASILFRIAHGKQGSTGEKLDLKPYKHRMSSAISTLSQLLRRYPHYEERHLILFQRGKAYEELNSKGPATQDYLSLVKEYPEAPETLPAYMALAAFSSEANLHEKAISYLRKVEARPESPYFPFALYKLAWSHYNLKQIATALRYATHHVEYYEGKTLSSDIAFRDSMLMDATVFFFEGFEQGNPQYATKGALSYFRSVRPGTVMGRMVAKYAKLLRSHNHDQELLAWKNLVLAEEAEHPETLDVLVVTYDHQRNHGRFDELIALAGDMVRLYRLHPLHEGFEPARRNILDTADFLQRQIIKNKHAKDVKKLSLGLAALYDAFTQMVTENDPRVPRVHYNLAETLFEIADFEGATHHYRWVVTHPESLKLQNNSKLADADLRAVNARYGALKSTGQIPKEISPLSTAANREGPLADKEEEWISWVDALATKTSVSATEKEPFIFEANRLLYSKKLLRRALDRLSAFALGAPSSPFAIPSATLVIDTRIASREWQDLLLEARKFLNRGPWGRTPFEKQLRSVMADANLKLAEIAYGAKNYEETLDRIDEFLNDTTDAPRRDDMLSLGANASIALARQSQAIDYLSKLLHAFPQSTHHNAALNSRAILHEARFEFAAATEDYLQVLEGSDTLKRKTLAMALLSGNSEIRRKALEAKGLCDRPTAPIAEDCDRYRAYILLDRGSPKDELPARLLEKARKGDEKSRTLWALVALQAEHKGNMRLSFHERLALIRAAAAAYKELEALDQLIILSAINQILPLALTRTVENIPLFSPLRASENSIQHRVETLREVENSFAQVVKIPWIRLRARTLNELASSYMNFAQNLRDIQSPGQLVMPFEEKGSDLRLKAFELASHSAIEDNDFKTISEKFFSENPSQAKTILETFSSSFESTDLGVNSLVRLDRSADWDSAIAKSERLPDSLAGKEQIQALWVAALRNGNYALTGFLIQHARNKKILPDRSLSLMQAVTLAATGAQAEGLAQVEELVTDLEGREKREALLILFNNSARVFDKGRVQKYGNELGGHYRSALKVSAAQEAQETGMTPLSLADRAEKTAESAR